MVLGTRFIVLQTGSVKHGDEQRRYGHNPVRRSSKPTARDVSASPRRNCRGPSGEESRPRVRLAVWTFACRSIRAARRCIGTPGALVSRYCLGPLGRVPKGDVFGVRDGLLVPGPGDAFRGAGRQGLSYSAHVSIQSRSPICFTSDEGLVRRRSCRQSAARRHGGPEV